MKTEEQIKKEIIKLLPQIREDSHGAGNGSRVDWSEVIGKVDAYLDVLELKIDLYEDEEEVIEKIKSAIL